MQRTVSITAKPGKKLLGRKFLILMTIVFLILALETFGYVSVNGVKIEQRRPTESTVLKADTAVDQTLAVVGGSITGASAGRVIINDNGTAFTAPAEVGTGGQFTVNLPLGNRSDQPLEAQITISNTEGFSLDVKGRDGATGMVRIDTNTWAFKLAANENDQEADLAITVAVSDMTQPGNYLLECLIEPLKF